MFSSLAYALLQDVLESLRHSVEDKLEIKEALQTDRPASISFVLNSIG